ncbi:MAG: hypothetical protein Fur0012_04360 [Elusimicrobiota bacterium]
MKKKLFFISLAVAAIIFYKKSFILRQAVSLPLEINISQKIAGEYFSPNNMLFITVKNSKGVPVGLKKIIDPVYPVKTKITSKDIFFQDILTHRLEISAEMNSHGVVGERRKGDFFSSQNIKTFIFSPPKYIQLDSRY